MKVKPAKRKLAAKTKKQQVKLKLVAKVKKKVLSVNLKQNAKITTKTLPKAALVLLKPLLKNHRKQNKFSQI